VKLALMLCVPVGAAGVTVTVQVAVPTTVCPNVQELIPSATLVELTVTTPVGVETGPLSVSATVTVKVALWPIATVPVSGLMVVEVARVFTVNEAVLLAAPGPLSVALITPVVLFFTPVVVPVTFTEMLHELLDATVPALKLTDPEPATAVAVPQVLLRPLGVATTNPVGKLSVKAKLVRPMVLGFEMVIVRLVLAFRGIEGAPKALLIVGGLATVTVAEAVLPVPPLVEVTAPVVLFFTPELVPVTFTMTLQEPLTATVPPLRLILPLPAMAVVVPPQVLLSPLGVLTAKPAGRVSVKATPFSATVLAAGLVMVSARLVLPFIGIAAAPNALLMLGGITTDSVCCAEAEPADAVSVGPPALASS
jgi:hypothetical protein